MAKLNYNRPVHRIIDDRKKETLKIAKKDLGTSPVIMSNVMRFGKYKNWHVRDIPSNYLEWLVSISDDSTALKYCRELSRRPKYIKNIS